MTPSFRLYTLRIIPLVLAIISPLWVAAEPVTFDRLSALPQDVQPAWLQYMQLSEAQAEANQSALDAELKTLGLSEARKAPDGGDFRPRYELNDPQFSTSTTQQLADAIISYQAPCGGWSKHMGYSRGPRQPGTLFSSQYEPGRSPHYLCTFDNGATTSEIGFLAMMWHATGREDCKAAALKGLDFIVLAQYPNGGWPQVFPLEGDYHDDITFNDDAMSNILEVLRDIINGEPQYAFVDDERRARLATVLEAGLQCVMAIQVRQPVEGQQEPRLAGWSAQYDALTFEPSVARLKEPVAIASVETGNLLRILMSIQNPSPQLIASIEAGLAWLEEVKVTNVRRAEVDGTKTYIIDSSSTEVMWARFYDPESNKPLFPGSEDGVIYNTYEEMARSNHSTGYDFYSTRPNSAVKTDQRKWRKRLAEAQ